MCITCLYTPSIKVTLIVGDLQAIAARPYIRPHGTCYTSTTINSLAAIEATFNQFCRAFQSWDKSVVSTHFNFDSIKHHSNATSTTLRLFQRLHISLIVVDRICFNASILVLVTTRLIDFRVLYFIPRRRYASLHRLM